MARAALLDAVVDAGATLAALMARAALLDAVVDAGATVIAPMSADGF
jgi:hypothetical protein